MQQYNQILDENGDWINGEPAQDGQRYRVAFDFGNDKVGYEEKTFNTVTETPVIELTNVQVTSTNAQLGAGNIWWIPQGETFTLTGDVSLPDADMMIIIERVASGNTVIDDLRAKASIVNGVVTINAVFTQSGNYRITADRLNEGLRAINADFELAFDKIEFDSYI